PRKSRGVQAGPAADVDDDLAVTQCPTQAELELAPGPAPGPAVVTDGEALIVVTALVVVEHPIDHDGFVGGVGGGAHGRECDSDQSVMNLGSLRGVSPGRLVVDRTSDGGGGRRTTGRRPAVVRRESGRTLAAGKSGGGMRSVDVSE